MAFFLGPRQTTASFLLVIKNPMLITERVSPMVTGSQPSSHWLTSLSSTFSILGMLGPHRSMS